MPSANFEPTDIGTVESTFPGQLLLGPILRNPQLADAMSESLEGRVQDRAGRRRPMLTTVHRTVYRPGSTPLNRVVGKFEISQSDHYIGYSFQAGLLSGILGSM